MRESVEIRRVDSREEMEERSLTQRFIDAMGGLSGIPKRGDYSLGTVMLQAIEKFSAMRAVQEELQSELAAMRQRAEEQQSSLLRDWDAAIARAERAEACLREIELFVAENDPRHLAHAAGILRDVAVKCKRGLSSPPADASTMGGDGERLIAAYLAGFEASAEGWNGEYPEGGAKDRRVKEDAEEYARAALAEMEQKS